MVPEEKNSIETLLETLESKLRDYFASCNRKRAVLGLSGGIDSALVAAIAAEALGPENVTGILMPSQYSSLHSVSDSIELANNLGIAYHVIPIDKAYSLMMFEMHNFFEKSTWSVAQENLQARLRGTILMTYSNRYDALLLNTTNKSELCTGYGTLYGDLCGALMVIADLYKTQVFEMARLINRKAGKEIIPQVIIEKAPSAELRPNQKDSDSLPAYEELDPVLHALVEEGLSPEEVVNGGVSRKLVDRVLKLKRNSAFKLLQIPPVLAVSSKPVLPSDKCI